MHFSRLTTRCSRRYDRWAKHHRSHSLRSSLCLALFVTASLLLGNGVYAQEWQLDPSCGHLNENTFGRPFDYYTATAELRHIVETPHFPPHVESLQRGNTSATPGHDISYTLRTFPNHPRALMAMINLGRKEKTKQPNGSPYTVDCWINRALAFKPDDGTVRLVYGIELMRQGKHASAIPQLLKAEESLTESGNVFYNLGLAYFEVGDYDNALKYAHKAYARGFNFEGLRKKLASKGHWRDYVPPPPEAFPEKPGPDSQ